MKDTCLIINTFSEYSDLWPMFFDSLDQHLPFLKRYVFVDDGDPDENSATIHYNKEEQFRNQFLSCIKQVQEKYILYTSEDYILYDYVKLDEIQSLCKILTDTNYNFVKLIKGHENVIPFRDYDNLFEIDPNDAGAYLNRGLEELDKKMKK